MLKLIESEANVEQMKQVERLHSCSNLDETVACQRLAIRLLTKKLKVEESIRFQNEREFEVRLLTDAFAVDSLVKSV